MRELVRECRVAVPRAEAFAWLARPAAWRRLLPPWEGGPAGDATVPLREAAVHPGAVVPLGRGMSGVLREVREAEHALVCEQATPGPFAAWRSELRVTEEAAAADQPGEPGAQPGELAGAKASAGAACQVRESMRFRLRGRSRLWLCGVPSVRRLQRMLAYRVEVARRDLERAHDVPGAAPGTVAVSGSTGFLGVPLCALLEAAGHRVLRLTRRPRHEHDIPWNPARGELDPAHLDGVDAVIHLAGENLAQRWSHAAKQRIRSSRVDGTTLLARTLAALPRKPAVMLSISATGIYGDTGETPVDESDPAGEDFLAEVCQAWEAAAEPARDAGIRVVHPRPGVVLGHGGGMLARLVPVVRAGVGGPLGSGRQYVPWIARDDALGALYFLLRHAEAHGAVNLVAPQALRNCDVVRTLGRLLKRPTWLPAPSLALRLVFGEMAQTALLAGQHVRPTQLEALGFRFRTPTLPEALAFELGLRRKPS